MKKLNELILYLIKMHEGVVDACESQKWIHHFKKWMHIILNLLLPEI